MQYEVVTNGGNLNVRSGPGVRYPVREKLHNGDKVAVVESRRPDHRDWADRWMRLGTGGWVSADFLEPVAVKYEVATKGGNLNVRSGPATTYPVRGSLRRGEKVDVIGSAAGWLQIANGGWVSAAYLEPVGSGGGAARPPARAPTQPSANPTQPAAPGRGRIDQSQLTGKIRDQPISWELYQVLYRAAEAAGIGTVLVTSGGQPGSTGRRTGSTRHDHGRAADLKLLVGGRPLVFSDSQAPTAVEEFVTAAAARGAIGIGAGVGYMGPQTLHVGFGRTVRDTQQLVWGAGGRSAHAPGWLRRAARSGWNHPVELRAVDPSFRSSAAGGASR